MSYYAAPKPVLPADEMFVVSVPASYAPSKPSPLDELGADLQQAATVQTISVTPFNQLVLDTRKTRNTFTGSLRAAASSMSPTAEGILAWVSPRRGEDVIGKGYNTNVGIYEGSEYYRESLFHMAL